MNPLASPVGFNGVDWLLFLFAALLLIFGFMWTARLEARLTALANHRKTCFAILGALPIILRLALLPSHPVPHPEIYDEFSHLLLADTLLHGRLANPPHPLYQFFETFYVLQRPTYSSIYPVGPGVLLALGKLLFGSAWAGVLVASGAFSALCYWMLLAWVDPAWALLGGILAVLEFGALNSWTNSYWGGLLAACAGCLVFGSMPRLAREGRLCDGALLGTGFGVHLITRQFESVLLFSCILLFLIPGSFTRKTWPLLFRGILAGVAATLPFGVLILLQNHAVTGSWTTLPEQLSQYQYGVPTTLTIQHPPVPHVQLTPQQALDYRAQALMHGDDTDSISRFLLRLEYRVRYYRFFFLPPLYVSVAAFWACWRFPKFWFIVGSLAIFALGTNLFPYLLVHYLAGVTCLFVLVSVLGLQMLNKIRIREIWVGRDVVRILMFLCLTHFAFWYSLHLVESLGIVAPALEYETWDAISHRDVGRHAEVNRELAGIAGKLLVFVHYSPQHVYQDEWVWNAADIDSSRVVFARDLGAVENEKLKAYYPDRKVLLLEPDIRPVQLGPYPD